MRAVLPRRLRSLALMLASFPLAWTSAFSQPIYKSIDADGRVTFSDRPLTVRSTILQAYWLPDFSGGNNADKPSKADGAPAGSAFNTLPPALQLIASRYPVTLYTGSDCAKCEAGRSLLAARGTPFKEVVINSASDLEQIQTQLGKFTLPGLTIGTLLVKDFSVPEWHGFLDGAGYPKTSALPAGFKNPPPAKWTEPIKTAAPRAATPEVEGVQMPAPAAPETSEPASGLMPLEPANNPIKLKF